MRGLDGREASPQLQEVGGLLDAPACDELVYVELTLHGCHIHALVDTGASRTVVRRGEFERMCRKSGRTTVLKRAVELVGVTGHTIKVLGSTEIAEEKLGPIHVIVVEGIDHQMILGRDVLRSDNATIDYKAGMLKWRGQCVPMIPPKLRLTLASLGEKPPVMTVSKVAACVERSEDLFAAKGEALGCHPDLVVRIHTEGPPIKRRPYRLPLTKRQALDEKMDELLRQGVIVPSSSPWASPVVLVEKKDSSEGPRFCVDFTSLNKVTKKDAYPIPLIRDIFDQLHGATIFSTLDLKSGFHQLPLHPDDQEKSAFCSHRGLFHWTRMPMGLSNASQMFQRAMEIVFKGLIGTICMLYIDDIVVYSKNEDEHVEHLEKMFARLRECNLKLNPKKCVFGLEEVKLLGYIVSANGLKADSDKVAAITRMQAPQNVNETRSFLGMTGYYRTCIQDYAHIAEPLVELTCKNIRYEWTSKHQEAFDLLKKALTTEQVMAHPQTDKPYLLYTDACDYAIGAILCQKDELGVERPIVYLSKQLSATQRRWATIEKEAYAVVHALKQLRPYLWGAEYKTYTDHKPLTCLFTKDMNNTKIQRWSVLLAEYNCKVEYHKGKLNVRADMLSRIRQNDELATFDVNYWQLGDPLPELPEDDQQPDIYGLDLRTVAQQQREMKEWTEHDNEDSPFEIINGLLYSTRRPFKFAPDHPRLVLPMPQREEVVRRAHLDVGHMAVVKTMRKVQEAFAWTSMKSDIRQQLQRCPTCIAHAKHQPRAPMGEMPIATAPVQIVAMDLVGPMVKTPEGNQYLLTIVDHCTGWAEAYPIPSKTSREVWKKLTQMYFPRHGYPDVMINDQGLEFGAKALREYLEAVGIDQRRTSSYNPQANGKCERFNGTLKQIISRLVNNSRSNWEDKLGPALMAYNNAVSDATGHTPFYLQYGRRARLPLSRLMRKDTHEDERLQHLADALRQASEATRNARQYNRARLERQANMGIVRIGDTVVIKAAEPLTLTSKWDPQWQVTKIRNKVVWVTHQQLGKQKVLNINKIRVVDPNIAWDELNPRPTRNPRQSARVTDLPPPPRKRTPPPRKRAPERRSLAPPDTAPAQKQSPGKRQRQAPAQKQSTGKRRRQESMRSTDSEATIIYDHQDEEPVSSPLDDNQHTALPSTSSDQPLPSTSADCQPRNPAQPRPAISRSEDKKRIHRAPERRAREGGEPGPVPIKRYRPFQPRAAKRRTEPDPLRPSDTQQKRARVEAIAAVRLYTQPRTC